jgi:hypothetical protein
MLLYVNAIVFIVAGTARQHSNPCTEARGHPHGAVRMTSQYHGNMEGNQ